MDWQALVLHDVTDFTGQPPTLSAAYMQVYSKASVYTLIFVVAWASIALLLRLLGLAKEQRGTWALKSAMLLHHGLITPLAIFGLWRDPTVYGMYSCSGCVESATLMNRATVPSQAALALAPVTLGYFIGDLLLISQWNLTKSGAVENALMLIHHIASLLVWPAAVHFDWVARYVVIMLSYEFTSFWLTVLWMLQTLGMKKSPLYVLAGLVFTVSFVLMRMVGAVPQLIAMWNAPPWSVAVERAAKADGIHPWCWIFSASLVLPHVMNLFWGVKVIKGFAQVFSKKTKKEGDGKHD